MLSDGVRAPSGAPILRNHYIGLSSRLHPVPKLEPMTAASVDVSSDSVEILNARIAALVGERQALRERAADPDALEHNRRAIAQLQWQLAHALIARYRPSPA